jgi:CRISPR/Cas system-associated endonuclease Cas1
MWADFSEQTVLVAGNGALSSAIAEAFSARGAKIVFVGESGTQRGELSSLGSEVPLALIYVSAYLESEDCDSRVPVAAEFFGLINEIQTVWNTSPRYAVALSSTVSCEYSQGAALQAAGEAALLSLIEYENARLLHETWEDIRINLLRVRQGGTAEFAVSYRDAANAAVALCSGLMDCMRGHVLTVDRGGTFADNAMRVYAKFAAP